VLKLDALTGKRHGCSEKLRNQTETLSVLFLKERPWVAAFLERVWV